MSIQSASITIVTSNLVETRTFYEKHFNARAIFDCGWYVVLRFNETPQNPELCLMEPKEGMQTFKGGAFLNLKVTHADTVFTRLAHSGLSSVIPLEDHPWGDRGFGILDPSGVMVYCYHPIEPTPEFAQYILSDD